MTIELLKHHVRFSHPSQEFGVFDGWQEKGLGPTIKDVQHRVTPRLKLERDSSGKLLYPFLSNNPKQKHAFEKRFLESYKAYLDGDYVVIPDYDPKTGAHNKDYLCEACPNWQTRCQYKTKFPRIESVG